MRALRPIGHEDRLSVIDHLDELRTRLFICAGALLVAFFVCFWQNGPLINILSRALPSENTAAAHSVIAAQPKEAATLHGSMLQIEQGAAQLERALAGARGVPPAASAGAAEIAQGAANAVKALPKSYSAREKPLVIGLGESFTTTLVVVAYFSLLFALPVILYQLYAYVIPALHPHERRTIVPSMIAAPALFMAGVVFTYFEVLPPAVHFLQGYNSSKFQIIPQASSFFKFEILLMLGIGLAFQVPLLLLALQKAGIITAKTLTLNWRYAIVLIAVVAAALPGVDPVTMFFETLPLLFLYGLSIVLLTIADRRDAKRAAAEAAAMAQQLDAS
jgi:sec-independent protein translocase protein TatC